MRYIPMALLAGLMAVSACEPAPPPPVETPEFGEAFPNIPLPPQARFVSRQGSTDALQVVLESEVPVEELTSIYRSALSTEIWQLVSDTRDSSGAVVLFAEGPKRPLWVRISAADSGRSRIELNGAVPGRDSAYVRSRQAAADTSNTMQPRPMAPPGMQ